MLEWFYYYCSIEANILWTKALWFLLFWFQHHISIISAKVEFKILFIGLFLRYYNNILRQLLKLPLLYGDK